MGDRWSVCILNFRCEESEASIFDQNEIANQSQPRPDSLRCIVIIDLLNRISSVI